MHDVYNRIRHMPDHHLRAAYDFLRLKAGGSNDFALDDLVAATGWKSSTVRTYVSKQWSSLLEPVGDGRFGVRPEFLDYPFDVFQRINSQKFLINKDPFKPLLSLTAEALIVKSREAALLAVQVYNNPTLTFRTPSFIVHMVIAFTSLFHAIFEETGTPYASFYPDGRPKLTPAGQPWLWGLSDCLTEYFRGSTSPVKENIRLFIQLRDEIEHRYAPAFDAAIAEHCQAMLINYERLIVEHFSPFYALGTGLSIPLQLTRTSSRARADAMRELQRDDFRILSQIVDRFAQGLPPAVSSSEEFRFRVLLVQVPANHAASADASMRFVAYDDLTDEAREQLLAAVTLRKTQQVPVRNLGNLRVKDVVARVQEVEPRFRQHEHTLCWRYFQVRPAKFGVSGCDTTYCQPDAAFKDFVYTEAWVEKLQALVKDPDAFGRVKSSPKAERQSSIEEF